MQCLLLALHKTDELDNNPNLFRSVRGDHPMPRTTS
jgi:hypothetical protein